MECAGLCIEVGDRHVASDHLAPPVGTAQAERHVLVLCYARRQPYDDALYDVGPLDLHAAVQQLDARVEVVSGGAVFVVRVARRLLNTTRHVSFGPVN